MSTVDHAAEVQRQIEGLLAPLREQDEQIDREIVEHQNAIAELRSVQNKVRALVRTQDPDYQKRVYKLNGKNGNTKKNKTGIDGSGISEARLGLFVDWITKNAEKLNAMSPDGFWASEVAKQYSREIKMHQSQISKSLAILHPRGVVRLTRVDKGAGGRKLFKVVV
jgi:hypothetical protein